MANETYRNYDFELESNVLPVAIVLPAEQEAVVSSLVKLDGTASIDPEGAGLIYKWRFVQVPIGSQVERFGFTNFESDASVVTFAPDVIGPYQIELIVSDGSLDSEPALAEVDVRIILVPYHKGFVPDASFIWNYLSDFWQRVEGRQKFETFWSAAIQIVSAELLKLYQYDYNKSIRDIQEVFQRRWLAYEFGLPIDRTAVTFILADDQAGSRASTFTFDSVTGIPSSVQPAYTGQIAVPAGEGRFSRTPYGTSIHTGRVLTLEQRAFVLSRSGDFTLSISNDIDGAVTSGTNIFHGNSFTSAMVGGTLRILGGVLGVSRDWKIAVVTSSTELTVTDLNGLTVPFPSSAVGLDYTILPPEATHNVFVADTAEVPAGLDDQSWRFSSTLISSEHDYEAQGVSPGDLIEVEITRMDLGLAATFFAQVVSVSGNRLGFVLNLQDLISGEAADWLTPDIQVTLATDLQVQGLGAAMDGSLLYTGDVGTVRTTLRSLRFKRAYHEKELTPFDDIDVGAFTIRARPVQIIRNKRLPVHETLTSVPLLQEYVRQPDIIHEGGRIYLVHNGVRKEAPREPYVLAENLDYVVDDEAMITGACELAAGSDEIRIPFGDLFDRSIQEQDTLTVTIGFGEQVFEIRRVLAADRVRVYPVPNNDSIGAPFVLNRRLKGKYLRFIDGKFDKKHPAPKRLWAEVSYFDNNETVEANFGVLVGLTREDISKANSDAPYKSAVAGLMYALSNGPTISNLKLAGQILLGMPFTQAAGVIKEINPNYRLREDGSTRFGRLLIEGRDGNNRSTGLTYIYLYPQGRQIFDLTTNTWISAVSDFSGLGINPTTSKEFAVGDAVGQFVPLSKGVGIEEYLITPEWSAQMIAQGDIVSFLRQYHSFKLVVNSDLVSAADIDLASQFLRKAKAHYVRLLSALLKSIEEIIVIEDLVFFGRQMQFYEAVGQGLPSALKFDDGDENLSLITYDGLFLTKYAQGDDLVTTLGSSVVVSALGGFLNPRVVFAEAWDPPLLRPGDLLHIFEGTNAGQYLVQSVSSDTQLIVELDVDQSFISAQNQSFAVYRPLRNPIWSGKAVVTTGDGLVSTQEAVGVQGGIASSGVMVGDTLVFADLSLTEPKVGKRYTVLQVVPDPVSPYIVVFPDPMEDSGVYDAWIIREALMTQGVVTPEGAGESTFWVSTSVGSPNIVFGNVPDFQNDWLNLALLRFGDLISVAGTSHMVLGFDTETLQAIVTPAPTVNRTDVAAIVTLRPDRGTTPLSFDFIDRIPEESLHLELRAAPSYTERIHTVDSGADVVSTLGVDFAGDLAISPGDYLVLLEGPDSTRDVGYGPGVFLIHEVMVGGSLRLIADLTATGDFRYGLQRRAPNEG